jgi:hypothetical protein
LPAIAIEIKKKEKNLAKEESAVPFSLDHIRKKYPLHFLLLNLLRDREK